MDDLYDNLENYNDVNIVDELKSENKELKLKLEEYSKAMAQLQKDFDKVNTEYKKLEINYSSLLKTARAEIERKTEMIKNLNMEKDMFIINSLKNTGKNVTKNFVSKVQTKSNEKSTNSTVNNDNQNTSEQPAESKNEKDNRIGPKQTTSLDSLSTISTENKSSCSDEKAPKSIDSYEKNKNREKFSKTSRRDESLKSDIMNRRKLMPTTSNCEANFSSDEDIEERNTDNLRKSPHRNDQYYEWHDTRDYRITEYYDSSREPYRNRTNIYIGHEKYRNIDKYDHFQKHRRNYSPDRNQYRYTKEQTENYQLKRDYAKQRVLRSPPSDKYNHFKSRDRRFNVERDNYRDYDKHPSRYGEHSAVKHKMRKEFDEPNSKRLKTESHSKCTAETKNYINEKEREIAERVHSKPQDFTQISSCQSPDYVHVDNNIPQHFIKEIRSTAITKLEDPRISSKRYFLKTSNDNTILSTVASRMIDIRCINKSVWGINKVDVPKALTKCPSEQDNGNLLKEIYMDIDNPVLNASLESGEIQNFDDDLTTFHSREVNKDNDNEKSGEGKTIGNENVLDAMGKVANSKILEKSVNTKFKIPKIKKPDKIDAEKDSDNRDTHDTSKQSLTGSKDSNHSVESKVQDTDKTDEHISKLNIGNNVSDNNVESSDLNRSIIDKRKQIIISTIEGDLELSDEASDFVEIHQDADKKSSTEQSSISLNNDTAVTNSVSFKEINTGVTSFKLEKTNTKENDRNKSSTKKGSAKDSSKENKKRKSKRKSLEQKETNCTTSKSKSEKLYDVKKLKEKESISKQTVNKFSDLFGDSSSLITLDDLGLNNVPVQQVNKFTSIFDNTQDAVDLSVEDISNTITSTKKTNTFDTILNELNDKDADITKHFSVNVTIVKENGDNNSENKNAPLNVYENTKSDTLASLDAPEVVKTVIISTGKQPECISDCTSNGISNNEPSIMAIPEDVSVKKCLLGNIEALATSTPHKLNDHVPVFKDFVSPSTNITETTPSSCSANKTDEHQNDADIPDVRIIVRRKRKVLKKAT